LISGSYSFDSGEDFVILANKPQCVLKARFKIDKILIETIIPLFHFSKFSPLNQALKIFCIPHAEGVIKVP